MRLARGYFGRASLMSSAARVGRLGAGRNAARHSVKPRTYRLTHPQGIGPPRQDQKDGLKGILGVVVVSKDTPADTHDHRAVPVHQGFERQFGGFISPRRELLDELPIGESGDSPDFKNELEPPKRGAILRDCHKSVLQRPVFPINP